VPQDRNAYADSFFSWVYDFNNDGHNDVLAVGFPGKPAFVFENPGPAGLSGLWERHQVADQVSNEAPQFSDLTGDGIPELICTRNGHFGYYRLAGRTADASTESKLDSEGKKSETAGAIAPWNFVEISDAVAPGPFVHGLGVGDVNGDGRPDLIAASGWWEHPAERIDSARWTHHPFAFAPAPADIHAYDIDGDGDQDIVTALHAHEYGLAWFENTGGKSPEFEQHTIVGKTRDENPSGILFTEPHSVKLEDINGDGLKDIVTGKTYWSHHTGSPMWDAGAVVYWFELRRHSDGAQHKSADVEDHTIGHDHNSSVEFVPHLADGDPGIGRQLVVADLNGDKHPDLVTGGMKGASVLLHQVSEVDESTWQQSQPKKTAEIAEGLSPADAAARMTVPDGFHLQLAAGEPMVHQPVAMCFDHRGRLWIAEAHTYPLRADDGKGKDRIVIFEDTNLDGAYDKSTVFIEGLNLVSALEVGFGGVFVGAAPYLMFIPDRDGDDRPDLSPVTPNGTALSDNITE
ncbi:MAG: PVC-type heme-binding CxxCH protein, partial [Planctomyces sp.]